MVETKKGRLNMEIDVDLPLDIIESNQRRSAVEEGLIRSISKGLYEEGVSFKLKRWISKLSNRVDIPVFGISFLSDHIKILRDQPKRMLPAGWTDRQFANIPDGHIKSDL